MRGLWLKTTTNRPDRLRDRRDIFTEIRNGAEIHLRNAKRSSIPHQANSPRPQHAKSALRPREIQRFCLRQQLTNSIAVQAFSSVTGESSTQQQHTSNRQLGHSVADFKTRHSSAEQAQSAQIIFTTCPTKCAVKLPYRYSVTANY